MNTPGLHHINVTVSDLKQAKAFYGDLLGFKINDEYMEEYKFISFSVGPVDVYMLQHEATPKGDRFSEFRIGLDHLSFAAPSEEALNELAAKLLAAGVNTKGVETFVTGNKYIAFRDPDNIQLEYWLP